jgi:hypothetical protein
MLRKKSINSPATSTPVKPPPTIAKVSRRRRRSGSDVGELDHRQNVIAQRVRVEQRFHRQRSLIDPR